MRRRTGVAGNIGFFITAIRGYAHNFLISVCVCVGGGMGVKGDGRWGEVGNFVKF